MIAPILVELTVNGTTYRRNVEPRRRLGDFLREDLGLTGTHLSCEHGVCGICTVLVDGKPRQSCLTLAVQVAGQQIRTVEDLSKTGAMSALQQAFWEKHALQCGFCTPGFLMALTSLLEREVLPTNSELEEAIDGIICRCTGYHSILEAAISARKTLKARNADRPGPS